VADARPARRRQLRSRLGASGSAPARHSFEAKAFNIVASGFLDGPMREELAALGKEAARVLEESPRAVSVVIGPTGDPVSEVLAIARACSTPTSTPRVRPSPSSFTTSSGTTTVSMISI
jgi:hypothetical protein